VHPGEVVALIGDNGAGKSTLVKCLSGVEQPDSGQILVDGKPVSLDSPTAARGHGIETAYQDLAVAPDLDPAANLFLGREIRRPGLLGKIGMLDKAKMRAEATEQFAKFGVSLPDLSVPIGALSGGQRQSVAVARSVAWASRLVFLDEPTAALGVAQTRQVLDLVRRLADNGHAVIFISHNMVDVFEVADRICALYLGRVAADVPISEVDRSQVIELITAGRSGNLGIAPAVADAGV
jgi:simple sugar transport system ATP-binding protein